MSDVTAKLEKSKKKIKSKKKRKSKSALLTAVTVFPSSKQIASKAAIPVSANWIKFQETLNKNKPGNQNRIKSIPPKTTFNNKNTNDRPNVKNVEKYTKAIPEVKPEIWFDDVDPELLDQPSQSNRSTDICLKNRPKPTALEKLGQFNGLTKALAMDCEMVGVGEDGVDSILARVSIVNLMGHCVYDKFVKATEHVTDFRTHISGVTAKDMENGEEFSVVQKEVCDMLKGRILVGHALQNDLAVLYLSHSHLKIRDTSRYKKFKGLFKGRTPALKKLSHHVLGVTIQEGAHSSVQDAQAAMRLYTMHRKEWEQELKSKTLKKKYLKNVSP